VFREKEGFSYDEVNAVFRSGGDDLVDSRRRLEALRAIRKSKNFEPLTVSFKRIRKILEKAAIPAGENPAGLGGAFPERREKGLYSAMHSAVPRVNEQKRAGHFREALEVIAALRPDVDKFFRASHGDGRGGNGSQKPPRTSFRTSAGVHDDCRLFRNRRGRACIK
jgi:glycyl-tRNA synthetase beta chain